MKLLILLMAVLQTAVYAEQAAGDFLRLRFTPLTQLSQMRIITKPRIHWDGEPPSVWEGDSCGDERANVWVADPVDDNSKCCLIDELSGFKIWVS